MMDPYSPANLDSLLEQLQPRTVLELLEGEIPAQLAVYKAEALLALDRLQEAHDFLDWQVSALTGDDFARAERVWCEILLKMGYVDAAILSAENAARNTNSTILRAQAVAWSAVGFASKRCWNLAGSALDQARHLAPEDRLVILAEARVALEMDERLQAREIYERLGTTNSLPSRYSTLCGLSYVSWLLGEFAEAHRLAESALQCSQQIITPLFVLGNIALALEDQDSFQRAVEELARRSPQAETLKPWRSELSQLKSRLQAYPEESLGITGARRQRLTAFPTTVQRRDYCGPCTVELVLRYWRDHFDLTNDQIARAVKLPGGGSPIYRMREFFHLIGFDTVRCLAPVERLKQLIDAGFPVIIQQEYSDTSHVAVVIGYDEATDMIELQDPMTHSITSVSVPELNRVRKVFGDSAMVAIPRNRGYDQVLARLEISDEPALIWTDQAGLALDENRFQEAARLAERAAHRLPDFEMAWILWLMAELNQWYAALAPIQSKIPAGSLAERLLPFAVRGQQQARQRFYSVLSQAHQALPGRQFIDFFEGHSALVDGDFQGGLVAFQRASEIDPQDSGMLCASASCYYATRQPQQAVEAARRALFLNPALADANAWMARSLVVLGEPHADHYARCAEELAPDRWLSHLVMAEVFLSQEKLLSAAQELEMAMAISPNQPEVLTTRAAFARMRGHTIQAILDVEAVLEGAPRLDPATHFHAYQVLSQVLCESNLHQEAIAHLEQALQFYPDDPWLLQYLATCRSQQWIQTGRRVDSQSLSEICRLYDRALEVKGCDIQIIQGYVEHLSLLGTKKAAISAIERMRLMYPNQVKLLFLHGRILAQAGRSRSAVKVMIEALEQKEAIQDESELLEAVRVIVGGLGPIKAEQVVMQTQKRSSRFTAEVVGRALGLAMAELPEDQVARARAMHLLGSVISRQPEDALATLRLGNVVPNAVDQETLYRRALVLEPRWPVARTRLVNFLLDADRTIEALGFIEGHEAESDDLLVAYGKALLYAGRCEDAATILDQAMGQIDRPERGLFELKWLAEMGCGRASQALTIAQIGQRQFSSDPAWYARIAASLRDLDRLDEASEIIELGREKGMQDSDVQEVETLLSRRHLI